MHITRFLKLPYQETRKGIYMMKKTFPLLKELQILRLSMEKDLFSNLLQGCLKQIKGELRLSIYTLL